MGHNESLNVLVQRMITSVENAEYSSTAWTGMLLETGLCVSL